MQFPLNLWDLSTWLAITAMILLVTAELGSLHHGQSNLLINKKRLKRAALAVGILFFVTVAIALYEMYGLR